MESEVAVGPELDRIACEAAGVKPEISYTLARSDGYDSIPVSAAERDRLLREWGRNGYLAEVQELVEYPPVSTDPGAALSLLLPALQARGFHAFTLESRDLVDWVAAFYREGWRQGYGRSPAEAVARAVLNALEGEEPVEAP